MPALTESLKARLQQGAAGTTTATGTAPLGAPLGAVPVAFFLSIMEAIEARQSFTQSRARHVANFAVATARALRLSVEEVDAIRVGALLGNVGMLSVPEAILQKTEALTAAEQQVIRQHPVLGAEMLASVPELKPVLPMVLHHHEDFNGGGYPGGISGEWIPLGARIIRVAETFDALTHPRPYRPACTPEEALEMLGVGAGHEFDPQIVTTFQMRLRLGAVRDALLEQWDEQREAARHWRALNGRDEGVGRGP